MVTHFLSFLVPVGIWVQDPWPRLLRSLPQGSNSSIVLPFRARGDGNGGWRKYCTVDKWHSLFQQAEVFSWVSTILPSPPHPTPPPQGLKNLLKQLVIPLPLARSPQWLLLNPFYLFHLIYKESRLIIDPGKCFPPASSIGGSANLIKRPKL